MVQSYCNQCHAIRTKEMSVPSVPFYIHVHMLNSAVSVTLLIILRGGNREVGVRFRKEIFLFYTNSKLAMDPTQLSFDRHREPRV